MKLLSLDPGGMNGACWFEDGKMLGFDQVKLKDLTMWLESFTPKPDLVLFENYRLWKHKSLQQSGSDMPAPTAIGIIKSYATRYGIEIADQSPQILKQAELMSHVKMPADHSDSHWVSAYLHGYWYNVKNGYTKVDLGDLA